MSATIAYLATGAPSGLDQPLPVGVAVIAIGGDPVHVPGGIRHVAHDFAEGPWGRVAVDAAPSGAVLLLRPGEVLTTANIGPARSAVTLVPVHVPPPSHRPRSPSVVEYVQLQPRLVAKGSTIEWGSDGLPLTWSNEIAGDVTIANGLRRWAGPNEFLDLVAAEGASAGHARLTLAAAAGYAERGEALAAERCFTLATSWLGGRASDGPEVLEARLAVAEALVAAGHTGHALDILMASLAQPEFATLAARLLIDAERFEDAEAALLAALDVPFPPRPLFRELPTANVTSSLGEIGLATGRFADARHWFEAGVQHDPASAVAWARLSVAHAAVAASGDALAAAAEAGALMADAAYRAADPFRILMLAGDRAIAVEAARQSILAGKPAYCDRAEALFSLHRFEETQDDLWTHLAMAPGDAGAALLLGRAAAALENWPEARAALEFACSLEPQNGEAVLYLAEVALTQGDAGEAEHWAARALAEDPSNPVARRLLARVFEKREDGQAAFETLAGLLEEAPHDTETRRQLTHLLVAAGEAQLAADVIGEALDFGALDTPDAPALLALASALTALGRLTDARAAADLAYSLAPSLRGAIGAAEAA